MSDYKFLGLNVWTYSDNRSIIWLGGKNSHYGQKNHYIKTEIGTWGKLGLEIEIGGEDREIQFCIGLGLFTLWLSLTGIIPNKYEKAKEIAKQEKCYAYEIDYSNEGRSTGIMINFKHGLNIEFSFWRNHGWWTSRTIFEKLKRFPYCEGLSKTFYFWSNY